MRIVIVLLLLANVTLYLYTRLDTGGGEAVLLQDQVQPDKIKLLTPQQVAALGPTKVAALNDVCVEWGPFSDVDRTRALADIEPLALGRLVSAEEGRLRQRLLGQHGTVRDASRRRESRGRASPAGLEGRVDRRRVEGPVRDLVRQLLD